ncbi:MAG TPA: ATP-binding protein [Leptolyngbyaceae cyanobacterium]
MILVNLKKFLTKKEVLGVINDLVKELDTSICILDAKEKILLGTESQYYTSRYPIEVAGELVGWICGEKKVNAVASLLTYIVKQENEKKSLANELLEKYQEIDLFHDLSTQITASLDLQEVAQLAIEEAGKAIASTSGAIYLLERTSDRLKILSEFGQTERLQRSLRLGEGIVGTIVQSDRPEIVNEVASDPRFTNSREPISSLICVPLKRNDRLIGAIAIFSQTPITYSASDLKLLSVFASQAAVAIEKALLYEQSCTAAKLAQEQAQKLQCALDELQQTQAQLIQSEKMSSLGQLVAGVAHEINNPVNFICGNITPASEYIEDLLSLLHLYQDYYPEPPAAIAEKIESIDLDFLIGDLPKLIDSIKLGIERICQIVLSLRNFSRLDRTEKVPVNIHEGIDTTLLILQHRLKASSHNSGIQIIKNYGNLPLVECHVGQLNQVFMNIIANAIDAVEDNKQIKPIIKISTKLLPNQRVAIVISDNGPGMTQDEKSKVFDPFFTTKPIGKGTGLGLSISYQIVVEKHGGVLKCYCQPGEGCEFWIEIPVAQERSNHEAIPIGIATR